MTLALTILAIVCIFTLPFGVVFLTRKSKILGAIGAIALCYLLGFAFSTIGLSGTSYDKGLTTTIAYVLVALSIPLILFGIDLRALKKLTRGTIVGYSLCIVSAVVVAVAMFFITLSFFPSANLSAMIVGLYTGGTPNLNAIGAAMGSAMGQSVEETRNVLSAANVSDTLVGGIYFLLLISVAPKVYSFFLDGKKRKKPMETPAFAEGPAPEGGESAEGAEAETTDGENTAPEAHAGGCSGTSAKKDDYAFGISIKDKKSIFKLIGGFFLSVACLGVGALLEFLIEGTVGENLLYILLSVSVLGVAFSFIRPIREIKGQYSLGMYLILMFSLALSMSIDWTVFLSDILPTLAFFACAQVSVILLHLILCKIFRVDGATAIVTSTAGVYGPPFIAPVAKAANRPDLIAPGVICGALGLAIGTLLGYGVGMLLLLV